MHASYDLSPRRVPELARVQSRTQFAETVGSPVLLVPIEEPAGEFARALADIAANSTVRLVPIGPFETVSVPQEKVERRSSGDLRPSTTLLAQKLRRRLSRVRHFVLALQKRSVTTSKAFSDRVSVGRARNNDIVFRHESVSKFHAWFEYPAVDRCVLSDATSKNGTMLNGKGVQPGIAVDVASNDVIHFGKVETILCYPELLWDAISPRGFSADDP